MVMRFFLPSISSIGSTATTSLIGQGLLAEGLHLALPNGKRVNLVKQSKMLSRILRHRPESVGLTLDPQGWVEVDRLLSALARQGKTLSLRQLQEIVDKNDKKRFAFSQDGKQIRAVQGHSVEVDLNLLPAVPPEVLYHGTVASFLKAISQDGLKPMSRHHVHLSQNRTQAFKVGSRRGTAVILVVQASRMHRAGYRFYLADNGVWLTDCVPAEYISKEEVSL